MSNYITIRTYTFVRLSVMIIKIQTDNLEPKYTIKIYEVFFTGSLVFLRGRMYMRGRKTDARSHVYTVHLPQRENNF